MIEYELDADAVPPVRFGISPLSEVGQSLKLLRAPERSPFHAARLRQMQVRWSAPERDVLTALVSPRLWTPDFLHPVPAPDGAGFLAELAAVADGPADAVVADLPLLYPGGRLPAPLHGTPDQVLARVMDALTSYWTACFEPTWHEIRRCLQSDLLYRGSRVTAVGLPAAMGELASQVSLVGRRVRVRLRPDDVLTYRKSLGADELVMTPSVFTNRVAVPLAQNRAAQIIYPARGRGMVWTGGTRPSERALRQLVGAGKSQLLLLVAEPRTTAELADLFSVTPSAVSQQLGVLARSGLVFGIRDGRRVLYQRTELGERLVAASGH